MPFVQSSILSIISDNDYNTAAQLERDLVTTEWILEKVRGSRSYAQSLYAALCNTDFTPNQVWDILQGTQCSFSWRHAGGIIADMRDAGGDYMDWYCSGLAPTGAVLEGHVTDEVRQDFLKLGWIVHTSLD